MALTEEQVKNLKEGQRLRMTSNFGLGKSHLDAKVTVIKIGKAGCQVEVSEILSVGEDNAEFDKKWLICAFNELTVLPE
jgi:hypothetical protein